MSAQGHHPAAAAQNGGTNGTTNKVREVAARLNVKADGWYSETPEGVLSSFSDEDDPDAPSRLLESLTKTAQ